MMKRITLLFIAIIACLIAAAQTDTGAIQQPVTGAPIEYTDTPAHPDYAKSKNVDNHGSFSPDFPFNFNLVIPIVAIVCVFGLPVFIVFIAFYFKHKNKKAKYRLAEQALAAGQPIPQEFFNEKAGRSILQKGITHVFTGIGLFIFLWAFLDEFSMGCIGLLIMFMGFGQIVIHYTSNKKENTKKPDNRE